LLDDVYGACIKTALLTAQRFFKVGSMRRSDIKNDFVIPAHLDKNEQWVADQHIPNVWDAARENDPKNKQVSAVPLSTMALQVIGSVPVVSADSGADYVFSVNGRSPIRTWTRDKARLDKRMADALGKHGLEFKPWQCRDLRRTAKTLMARAGVL